MSSLTDSDGIPIRADEGESFIVAATFKDPDKEQFNSGAITGITATLLNKADNSVINSRDDQSVLNTNGGVLESDGSFELTLAPADNPIVDSDLAEEVHILILKWNWVDEAGATQTGVQKWDITVVNLESANEDVLASATEGLDLSGIKRVKTKHIEIETHDPRAVQEARDRENTALPSFCGLTFCIGTPRRTRRYE